MKRLLMVIVDELLPEVIASMVTVLLPALAMRSALSKIDGAPPDQLPGVSHLPVPSIQLLVAPWAVAARPASMTIATTKLCSRVLNLLLPFLTRARRGEDEALWVERARKQSVRALKKAVKDPDGAKPDDPDEEEEGVTFCANLAAELRPIVDEAEELAGKAVGATSPRWERTRAVCQEYLGAHPAPDDGDEAGPFLSSPADDLEPLKELLEKESEQWASLGRPAPVPAPELVSGAADVRALDAELRRFARQRERWGDVFGFVAMVFIRVRGWEYVGFASFKHYCEERLGTSVRAVEQRATLERRLYELPPLREAMREPRVSYEQARLIARHADAGSVRELIERAEQLTCIELRRELQGKEEAQMCARRQYRVWLPLSVAGLLALTIQAVRKAEGRWLPAGECYARACAHFIEVWKPALSGPSTVPKRVLRRDRGFCKVPVCSRAAAHAHHIAYRSAGGSDDMTNLTSLCAPHHLRGVHMGRVRIRPVPPDRLRWELGVGEGGAARRNMMRAACRAAVRRSSPPARCGRRSAAGRR